MIYLVAIDPGLDRVSLARFKIPLTGRWRTTTDAVARARCFDGVEAVRTLPDTLLPHRLERIACGVCDAVLNAGAHLVLVELPRVGGAYGRHHGAAKRMGGKINESLTLLYLATGAVVAGAARALGAANVECVPAQTAAKGQRLDLVRHALRMAGMENLTPLNTDDLDAIGIGLGADWPY